MVHDHVTDPIRPKEYSRFVDTIVPIDIEKFNIRIHFLIIPTVQYG